MTLFALMSFVAGVAADYLKYQAFTDTSCGVAPAASVVQFIDVVECINSTHWKHDPRGRDEGFSCTYPSPEIGTSSSYLCFSGKFNRTEPLDGAALLTFPSRDSCDEKFSGFQQFTPGACVLFGPESTQVLCDRNGVSFNRFHDKTCAGSAYNNERYSYGCNLSSAAYFSDVTCSGFPPA